MSQSSWSFEDFIAHLRRRAEDLRDTGAAVEFHHQETIRPSVRLRIERAKRLGELTVWKDGSAHMAVADLQSDKFIFERDGVSLAQGQAEQLLVEFFDKVGRE